VPDFLTRTEVEAIAYRAIRSIDNTKIDPASVKKKGSTMNILTVGAGGALCEEVQRRAFAKIAALTRRGARGDELDAKIFEDTFGQISRLGAQPAVTTVEIARAVGGAGGVVKAGAKALAGAIEFTLDVPVPFAAGQKGPLRATVTSKSAGSATNVPKGAIKAWADPGALFDPTLDIVSIEDAANGEDPELDEALVARAERWADTLARGTLAAIELRATQVAGVRHSLATESLDAEGYPAGPVVLYVADSFGNANEALCLQVLRILRDVRCGGVPVRVVGSVPSFSSIVLSPGFLDGFSIPIVQTQARALVAAAVNRITTNATLERSLIATAMRSVPGLVVTDKAIVSPAGDIVPRPGETIRTREDLITFV